MLPLLSKTVTLLYAIDGPGLEPPHKSATSSVQKNIKGSAIAFHVMPSVWYAGLVAEMLFETHFELDTGLHSTVGTLTHCRPQTRPMCWLNCRKGSNATCRLLGLTTAAGCWQEPASLEHRAWNSRLAARNQEEVGSQSHLLVPTGSHVRGRLSARLCGKEARAASIFFHSHHEQWPTDRRRQRSHVHPPPTSS